MYTYLYNIIIPKLTVSGGPKEESMVVCIYIHIHSEVPATYLWRFGVAHNQHTTLPERPFPCSYACIHVYTPLLLRIQFEINSDYIFLRAGAL